MDWDKSEGVWWKQIQDAYCCLSEAHRAYNIATGINDTDTFAETQADKTDVVTVPHSSNLKKKILFIIFNPFCFAWRSEHKDFQTK